MNVRDEGYYRAKLTSSGVPEHMHDGYVLYLLHGISPGSFGLAVLENDLREACARADEENQRALYRHVYFLYNYAPSGCWGSPEQVNEWIARHRSSSSETSGRVGEPIR